MNILVTLCAAVLLILGSVTDGAPSKISNPQLNAEVLTPKVRAALEKSTKHPPPYTVAELEGIITKSEAKPVPAVSKSPAADGGKKEWNPVEKYDARAGCTKMPIITEPVMRMTKKYKDDKGNEEIVNFGPSEREFLQQELALKDDARRSTLLSASSLGPLRLRKSIVDRDALLERRGEITKSGPEEGITKISGATFSFSDNRLPDGDREWDTQGALYMPFDWIHTEFTEVPSTGANRPRGSTHFHIAPGAEWKYHRADKEDGPDINELKLSVPFSLDTPVGTNGNYLTVTAEPFYQTDFDFDGRIVGALGTISYRGKVPLLRKVNDWVALRPGPDQGLYRRIVLEGNVDYSNVERASNWISRPEGDHWLRVGGKVGLDIAYRPKHLGQSPAYERKSNVIDFSLSYRWMDTLSGNGGSSDIFDAKLTYWINDFAGITAQYQRGDTPVAEATIDLLTFGIELRY